MATSNENLIERRQEGFRMLGSGSDCGLVLRGLHARWVSAGRDRRILATLTPDCNSAARHAIAAPAGIAPSRPPGNDSRTGDQRAGRTVRRECGLIAWSARIISARNLTTGLVTFDPSARLAYHTHPVSESITVLSGAACVAVEGREYTLGSA